MSNPTADRLRPRSFRPDPPDYTAAQKDLSKRNRGMGDFLRACLAWLHTDPDGALAVLAPHWPPPRPRGRRAHRSPRASSRTPSAP